MPSATPLLGLDVPLEGLAGDDSTVTPLITLWITLVVMFAGAPILYRATRAKDTCTKLLFSLRRSTMETRYKSIMTSVSLAPSSSICSPMRMPGQWTD